MRFSGNHSHSDSRWASHSIYTTHDCPLLFPLCLSIITAPHYCEHLIAKTQMFIDLREKKIPTTWPDPPPRPPRARRPIDPPLSLRSQAGTAPVLPAQEDGVLAALPNTNPDDNHPEANPPEPEAPPPVFPNELFIPILKHYATIDARGAARAMRVDRFWHRILQTEVYRHLSLKGVDEYEDFMNTASTTSMSQVVNLAFLDLNLYDWETACRFMAVVNRHETSPFTQLRGLSVELPLTNADYLRNSEPLPLISYFKPQCFSTQTYLHPLQGSDSRMSNVTPPDASKVGTITHLKLFWIAMDRDTLAHILKIKSLQKLWFCIEPTFWSHGGLSHRAVLLREALDRGITVLVTMKDSTPPLLLTRAFRRYFEKEKTYPNLIVLYDSDTTEPFDRTLLPWDTIPAGRYRDLLNPENPLTGVFDM
ncbi:hypothetical protein SISNIDRAFT_455978 [Sistotremastrum niveocremeum HHB9708]|uniref:Uncharacterized protein n=1 Tax=Sistotremastrum niveocremeum HHB9708 TaxID=1314777 RepID=A0A164TAU6_9AGAM|nr:hypothetical protein SISNIDRAFT_455978 [Sistotremastrum niveocremeum HHB9708]